MQDYSEYQIGGLGHHALVLGGSGDIGMEVVRAFVANGVRLISFTYWSGEERAKVLAREIEAQGARVYFDRVEALDLEGFARFLDRAVETLGAEIDMVVNAAGHSPNTPLEEQTLEEHLKVFAINRHGPFFTARAVATRMRDKGVKGVVALISSSNGVNSYAPFSAHYDGAKCSLGNTDTKNLALYFAKWGIRVNSLALGWSKTRMNHDVPNMAEEEELIWLGRQAAPQEPARFLVAVCSNAFSFATGQNFLLDGGYR
jgi:NAD(P)-dependent dehydrogenase (short-subunit alcohol dehydrogenase family)